MKQSVPVRLRFLYVGGGFVLLALLALLVGLVIGLDGVTRAAWSLGASGIVILLFGGIGFALYDKVDKPTSGRGSSK